MVAKTRIVAQFMHENEREFALPMLDQPIVSGKIVVGDIETEDIARLEAAGLLVSEVDEGAPRSGSSAELARPGSGLAPRPVGIGWGGPESVRGPALPAVAPRPVDVYVVSVSGPLLSVWAKQLKTAGAEVLEYLQANRYLARIRLARLPDVSGLPFVVQVRVYAPRDTLDPTLLGGHAEGAVGAGEMVTFELLVHRAQDRPKVRRWLDKHQVPVALAAGRKIRFFSLRSSAILADIARLPEVAAIDEYVPPRLSNDRARRIVGIDSATNQVVAETGKGQIIGVADTGLDKDHPDLVDSIVELIARGRKGDPSDPHGHGTHVAGSIVGTGAASNGRIRGTAPGAKLVFQSIMDSDGRLSGLDPDLADLFDEAYQAGARIHSNSWGSAAEAGYRVSSIEVDEYVYAHPDMLVVIAAGNAAIAANPVNSPRGLVDLQSLDAPGTAKNALTVGASRNDRKIPQAPNWKAWWPQEFPDDPIAGEAITGDPEAMAAFSGRGPCDETVRIKPDVVAPGTFILSTKAETAPIKSFWPPPAAEARYAYMGGTSMATPIVAGCAALVREHFAETLKHVPSAALLKATLVNGTRWLTGADSVATNAVAPNVDQGFGRVHLPWTIPNPGVKDFDLLYADEWDTNRQALAYPGDAYQFVFKATGKGRLRLCLAWTDPPGRGIQNSLVLTLEHPGSGKRWSGNQHRVAQLRGADLGNNVQVIRIDAPAAEQYVAQVTARNIILRSNPKWGPQRFALVVGGGVTSPADGASGLGVIHAQ